MKQDVVIKGDQVEIALLILGQENIAATNPDDLDWLSATLSVKAGPFAGAIDLQLRASEIVALQNQVETVLATLEGGFHFASMEDNWTFDVTFKQTGTAVITGTVKPKFGRENVLQYEFESDPISLERVARDLRQIAISYSAL